MNQLLDQLKSLLLIKKSRYITPKYIKSVYGETAYSNILSSTSFLREDATTSERIFCFVHDITQQATCLHCNNHIYKFEKFYNNKYEYLERFCSHSCIRRYMYDMSSDIIPDSNYSEINIKKLVADKNFGVLRLKPHIMNRVKIYLNTLGVDYRSMEVVEALYFIKNNLSNIPKCYCGNVVKYFGKGSYRQYCSNVCVINSEQHENLKKSTCLKKYGHENVFQCEDIKNVIKGNNIKKYGVDHYTKTQEYKNRIKNGDIKRISVDPILMRNKVLDRTYSRLLLFNDKINIQPMFTRDEYVGTGYHTNYRWKCLLCNNEFTHWYYEINKLKCPFCNKNTDIEDTIIEFLAKLKIRFILKSRSIISPYELDIYLPDHNVAIEINGLYWHSDKNGADKKYHLNKTEMCQKNNIRLIHLFADEIMFQKRIVFSRLKHILGLTKSSIYARKCTINVIDTSLKNKFLDKYHIQGSDKSLIKLGLFYKTRLVGVMTFSKLRKPLGGVHVEGKYELSRYATVSGFNIVGGAAKLVKYFERTYNPLMIISYADRRWSNGDVYNKIGFTLDHVTAPSYWYTKDYLHRLYRFGFRKSVLCKKLEKFDIKLSEWENMKLNGYDRVWDCGHLMFTKQLV